MKYIEFSVQSLDRFSAQNSPKDVCAKMNALEMPGFCVTQTGMLTAVEPMRTAAAAAGLKFIPGIKTFYRQGDELQDLRLIAIDYAGFSAIGKAVTDAQNDDGYAIMTEELLRKYFAEGAEGHGHVVATSAGMDGPLARIILRNRLVDERIRQLKRRYQSAAGDIDVRLQKTTDMLSKIDAELAEKKAARDNAKKLSESKFDARAKRVERLREKQSPEYEAEARQLDEDRKAAEEAKGSYENLKKDVTKLLKRQSILTKEKKELETLYDAHWEYREKVRKEEERKLTETEIEACIRTEAERLSDLFGKDNFFVEVQYHGADGEKEVFGRLPKIAEMLSLPIIAANDVHILDRSEDERLRRQILRSMKDGTKWIPEQKGDEERYIKSGDEMYAALTKIMPQAEAVEAIANTVRLYDRADVQFPEGEKHYPKYPTAGGMTANEALEAEIQKGIAWRFPNGMDKAHYDRLAHEIKIIEGMGYADYHLIVKDFLEYGRTLAGYPVEALEDAPLTIEEAKKKAEECGYRVGIATGPGRGSAVGSLVCYLLGITSLDPLKYDLLFERFLNPERVSMPDIDSDLSNSVRGKVIKYVQHKYGEESVCGIITMDGIAPKGAIRTAAKYYGLKKSDDASAFQKLGDQMARLVPDDPGTSFASDVDGKSLYEALQEKYQGNPDALEILRWSKVLEGSFTTYGVHAGGVVISDNHPIKEYLPMRWNSQLKEYTTQCDMYKVEERGLIKMDFLGLKTLDVITDALRVIEETTGRVIDPLSIPIDDKNVFREIFAKANTGAAFQFESSGMRAMLKRFKPETFEDLIILVSMFRPGPLQYIDNVIAIKNGTSPRTYLTPELEPILGRTYCGIVYQEQVMEIFQQLAGYTLGGADMVRRAMSKKKLDKLAHEREAFIHGDPSRNIDGCEKRGISVEAAEALFDQMTEFAKYAFNKSHAAAYALVAYWTGWLKYHYPAAFLCAAMTWADSDEKLNGLIREANTFGVRVLPPDVNLSKSRFSVSNGQIVYGLSNVKSVGESGAMIVRARETGGQFKSIKDLLLRVPVAKGAMENLIKAGAFDSFSTNRQAMLAVIESMKKEAKKYLEKQALLTDAETLLKNMKGRKSSLEVQKELGITVADKDLTEKQLQARIENARQAADTAYDALGSFTLATDTEEDLEEKLSAEHELLRAYISGHPLDAYDTCLPGYTQVSAVDENTVMISGLVTNLRLKNRKSDGKPMAFFTLEDKTGTIEVCVFTNAYAACAKYLKEGRAAAVSGKSVTAEEGKSENGVREVKWEFYAESMSTLPPARRVFLPVSSYYRFHVTEEKAFREKFENPTGYRLVLFDETLKETREADYRVDAEIFSLPNVRKL